MVSLRKIENVRDFNAAASKWKATKLNTAMTSIDPRMAADMLEFNTRNRPLHPSVVKRLAEKMKAGEWVDTHEGIGFDVSGTLVDGQHRLQAIIASGETVRMLVTVGLPIEAYDNIDTEGSRTTTDLLYHRVQGIENITAVASVGRAMLRSMAASSENNARALSRTLVVDFTEKVHTQIQPFVRLTRTGPAKHLFRPGVVAAFTNAQRAPDKYPGGHGHRDPMLVLGLAERITKQEWEGNDDPMKVLFARLMKEDQLVKTGRSVSGEYLYTLAVGAIRAALAGRKLTKCEPTDIDWGDPNDRVRIGTGVIRRGVIHRPRT